MTAKVDEGKGAAKTSVIEYTDLSGWVRGHRARLVVALVAACTPQKLKHAIYRRLLGWDVDPTARVGFSILHARHVRIGARTVIGDFNLIDVHGSFEIGPDGRIGFLNLIHGCEVVRLGSDVEIAYRNRISGPPLATTSYPHSPNRRPEFHMGDHSGLVAAHRIECSDTVTMGTFTYLGGGHCVILTHGVNAMENVIETSPVTIGDYCLVGTHSLLQAGADIPDRTIVAPRAVVHGRPGEPEQLIGGVPARPMKKMPADAKWFTRTSQPF